MATRYRKPASNRRRRREHGGVPQLAARLAGCHISMVYKVRNGQATSAKVSQAIEEAERQIRSAQGAVA